MGQSNWGYTIHIEGHSPDERIGASFLRVGPRYFETIGARLLRGRVIGEEDTPASVAVAVINKKFAHEYFPKEDPIGKHFGFRSVKNAGDMEIVGIVEDTKYDNCREPAGPTFFMPFLQPSTKDTSISFIPQSQYFGAIELRAAGRPENLGASVRRTLAEINPNLTVLDIESMHEQIERNFNGETLVARLTELFGALALILACIGLYGVTAYSVARRTNEIGIRMALGADRQNVLKMVLRGALLQLGIGLAIGIPAALVSSRLIATQLYGVRTYDPAVLEMAVGVLAACTLLAGFIPARRAAAIEPMDALRTD